MSIGTRLATGLAAAIALGGMLAAPQAARADGHCHRDGLLGQVLVALIRSGERDHCDYRSRYSHRRVYYREASYDGGWRDSSCRPSRYRDSDYDPYEGGSSCRRTTRVVYYHPDYAYARHRCRSSAGAYVSYGSPYRSCSHGNRASRV